MQEDDIPKLKQIIEGIPIQLGNQNVILDALGLDRLKDHADDVKTSEFLYSMKCWYRMGAQAGWEHLKDYLESGNFRHVDESIVRRLEDSLNKMYIPYKPEDVDYDLVDKSAILEYFYHVQQTGLSVANNMLRKAVIAAYKDKDAPKSFIDSRLFHFSDHLLTKSIEMMDDYATKEGVLFGLAEPQERTIRLIAPKEYR